MKQANINNKNMNLFENYFCRSHLKISKENLVILNIPGSIVQKGLMISKIL